MNNKKISEKPNHLLSDMKCPQGLADVDLFSPGAQEHWYEAYDILHQEAPIHRIPGEGFKPGTDAFIVTRYEDIAAIVRDQDRFPLPGSLFVKQIAESGLDPFKQEHVNVMSASMATLRPNPELWRSHRQELTDPWIGPGATRHKDMVTRVANELIDQFIERRSVEWVGEFAQPLPQIVMANVLGWPLEDLHKLKQFGDGCVQPFVYGSGHRNQLQRDEIKAQFAVRS
jgi:cytochrome P450